MSRPANRDPIGSLLGLLVFLGGVGLLTITFKLAFDQFSVPPSEALKLKEGQAIDLSATGNGLIGIVVRILTLLLMSIIGSLVANRGVHLYTACRGSGIPASPQKPTTRASEEKDQGE